MDYSPERHIDRVLSQACRGFIVSCCLAGGGKARYFDVAKFKEFFHTKASLTVHNRVLQNAGYIEITKTRRRNRPNTIIRLTPLGKRKGKAHLAALTSLQITNKEATQAS